MREMMIKDKSRKDFYQYYNDSKNKILFRWIDFRKVMLLKRIIKKEQQQKLLSILEIGAGAGTIMSQFSQDHRVYALDINERLLHISKRNGLLSTRATVDAFLPFKKETFDIIISIDAIEHFSYRHHTLEEMSRILKRDGLVVHFTPPYDSVSWIIAEKMHNFLLQTQSDHVSPFTKESLLYLLQRCFYDVRIKYLNMGMTMCCIARRK